MNALATDIVLLDGSNELDRDLVGGKAWSVNHMRRLGLPVPPAFTLGTDVGRQTLANDALPAAVIEAIGAGVAYLQTEMQRTFGGSERPLLVSVRSGAARSMPGMMDTVLNIGATTATLKAIAAEGGQDLADDISARFAAQFVKVVGDQPPDEAFAQLIAATTAVFRSWNSPRAIAYRQHHGLVDDCGTAVTVQAMALGNLDDASGTGVLFSRNPLTGRRDVLGEWLPRAQGEDVVSGRISPLPLSRLAVSHPAVHAELIDAVARLELDAREVQDVEFTVESGSLWLLQTRTAKRSPEAAIRIAAALRREGLLSDDEALGRITAEDVSAMLRPRVDPTAAQTAYVLARGEPACPGVRSGFVVATADEAVERAYAGVEVILATATTEPDDVHGMVAATAIITELGGATSHAAVVSRELGRPAVVGCGVGSLAGLTAQEVTVDGGAGLVYAGRLPVVAPASDADPDLAAFVRWAEVENIDQLRMLLARRDQPGGTR